MIYTVEIISKILRGLQCLPSYLVRVIYLLKRKVLIPNQFLISHKKIRDKSLRELLSILFCWQRNSRSTNKIRRRGPFRKGDTMFQEGICWIIQTQKRCTAVQKLIFRVISLYQIIEV